MIFKGPSGVPSAARHAAPTLTEVVDAWESAPMALDAPKLEAANLATVASLASVAFLATAPNEEQIVQRVMSEVQRQIDLMLEVRLREALMPVLARATDSLVLEARTELASTLQQVVKLSVATALAQLTAQHGTRNVPATPSQIPSTDPRYPGGDAN